MIQATSHWMFLSASREIALTTLASCLFFLSHTVKKGMQVLSRHVRHARLDKICLACKSWQDLTCFYKSYRVLQVFTLSYNIKKRLIRQASLDLVTVYMFLQVIQGPASSYRVLQVLTSSYKVLQVLTRSCKFSQGLEIYTGSYKILQFLQLSLSYTSGKILKVLLVTGRRSWPKWQGVSTCSNKSYKFLQVLTI